MDKHDTLLISCGSPEHGSTYLERYGRADQAQTVKTVLYSTMLKCNAT